MLRTKQARSRSRRPESFLARLELLEDRLPPGTILALAGSALSDLSFGRLDSRMPFVGSERDSERASAGLSQISALSHFDYLAIDARELAVVNRDAPDFPASGHVFPSLSLPVLPPAADFFFTWDALQSWNADPLTAGAEFGSPAGLPRVPLPPSGDERTAATAAGDNGTGDGLIPALGRQSAEGNSETTLAMVHQRGDSAEADRAALGMLVSLIGTGLTSGGGGGPSTSSDPGGPSQGVDYWLTFPGNHNEVGTPPPVPSLFITGNENTTGIVAIPGLSFSAPFSVTAGAITTITLPTAADLGSSSGVVENKGIHVSALKDVTVYGLNYIHQTTDTYLGLPTHVLGTEYIVQAHVALGIFGATQLAIVAATDGTTVSITPPGETPFNTPPLNQGQTYQLRRTSGDLSGTIITANKPIAVFGSTQCATIPTGAGACNYIVEQLPPTASWGANFVTMPLATRLNGDTFRFLASTNSTQVRVNGSLVATLNRGQVHERIITGPAHITATKPILVAQYSNGQTYSGFPGDPSMMLVPSTDQFLDSYTVTTATPTNWFTTNRVSVLVADAAVGQVTLDGVPIPAGSFTAIGSSGYSGAQVTVSVGTHTLAGPSPFGAFVYGFADFDAYSYPAGMLLREREIYSNSEPPFGYLGDEQDTGGTATGVYVHNGEFHHRVVDLEIPGRGFNWRFERAYRSGVQFKSPLGYNWDFNYNRRLRVVSTVNLGEIQLTFPTALVNDVVRITGLNRADLYVYNAGDGSYTAPAGFYTRLVRNTGDGTFTERDRTGMVFSYAAPDIRSTAAMTRMTDRAGNTMQFLYNQIAQLETVIDTLGRPIQYFYDARRRLEFIVDFSGRSLSFTYSANGDLETVVSPAVTGTVTGNDFPDGKPVVYTYSSGFADARLNHNLRTIVAPNEAVSSGLARRVIAYNETTGSDHIDRVENQTIGGTNASGVPAGGTINYAYELLVYPPPGGVTTEAFKAIVTDRNGNQTQYFTNPQGNILRKVELTNRNLRPTEGDYTTRYAYNQDYELLSVTFPLQGILLSSVSYGYDTSPTDRLQQGNLRAITRTPDAPRGGDQSSIVTRYETVSSPIRSGYEPIYNQARSVIDPRGNDSSYRPPIQLAGEVFPNPGRYNTRYTFDYEEGCDFGAIDTWTGRTPGESQSLLNAAGMCVTPLGDVNGDGVTNQVAGNVIRVDNPSVNLPSDSNQQLLEGAILHSGTATGGTANTMTGSFPDQYPNQGVQITGGKGKGQVRKIVSNTASTITVDRNWTTIPDTTSTFVIVTATTVQPSFELYTYNQFSQLTKTVDPESNVTQLTYYSERDPNGDGTIDNPAGNPTTGGYLSLSSHDTLPDSTRNSKTNPVATIIRRFFQYDAVGNTTLEYDGRGITTRYAVNQLNQVVQITRAAGPPSPLPFTPDLEPLALLQFQYLERFFYDYNNNVVLHQIEDRGNTSEVDGNPPITFLPSYITNPDPPGGTAYADTVTRYDILDNPVDILRQIDSSVGFPFTYTRMRYDRNQNAVFTIYPSTNAASSVYDERDLLFQSMMGAKRAPLLAQMRTGSESDPINYLALGGLTATRVYHYDGNRNLVETVDADDTDGSHANNSKRPTGVTTSAAGTSLQDTNRTWTIDQWQGRTVCTLNADFTCSQTRTILSNSSTTLTLTAAWSPDPGPGVEYVILGDRTRTIYDGFDRSTSTVDSVGNQSVTQYDPSGNAIRASRFGPSIWLNPMSDGPDTLAMPVSNAGTILAGNLVNANLLAATESKPDERNRAFQTDRVLFVNTIPLQRPPADVADGASSIGKGNLVPGDTQAIPGVTGITILGRVNTRTEYDRNSRPTFTVEDDADNSRALYDGAGRAIMTLDPEGNTAEMAYDDNGNVIETRETDVAQMSGVASQVFLTTSWYDSLNRLARHSDNLGQTVYRRYDSRNNLVATADAQRQDAQTPLIQRRIFSNDYFPANLFGNVTRHWYDGLSRPTRQETILTVSGQGDGIHIGATTEGVKDVAGIEESFPPPADTNQGGGDGLMRTGTIWNNNSLQVALLDDQGNVSVWVYDSLNRAVATTKGLTAAGIVSITLNKQKILGLRNLVTPSAATINAPAIMSDAQVNSSLSAVQSGISRVISLFPQLADDIHDMPPTTIVSGLDPDGNLLIREDENDTETFTRFDAVGRAIAVRVFRFGQTDSHAGDPLFAPAPVSDPSNPSAPVQVIGTTKQNFEYDGLSRLTRATDNNDPAVATDDSVITNAYDSLGRGIEETQRIGTMATLIVSSAWRAENLRTALTYPNPRRIDFTYDRLDRYQNVRDPSLAQPFAQYVYIGGRVLERRNLMNNTRLTFVNDAGTAADGYDGNQRVVQQRHRRNDNSLVVGFAHTYNRTDTKLTQGYLHNYPGRDNNEVYSNDSAYRLKSFTRPGPGSQVPLHSQFTLDGVGNWKQVDGVARRHSSFNEITQRGITNLASDDNGNTTNNGTFTFAFDFQNRLRKATAIAGSVVVGVYSYDAVGRRARSANGSGSVTRDFALDGSHEIEERENNNTKAQYVFGGRVDEPVVYEKNLDGAAPFDPIEDRLYYHENALGSVIGLTNGNALLKEGYLYDAYGRQTVYWPGLNGVVDWGNDDSILPGDVGALGNPFMFTARRLDAESGLYYYRARHLDTEQGRFLQRDPIGYLGDANLYGYLNGNPANGTDPFGLQGTVENALGRQALRDQKAEEEQKRQASQTPVRFFLVVDELLPGQKVVRKVFAFPQSPQEYILANPEKFGIEARNPTANVRLGDHALNNNPNSQYTSASRNPLGAANIQGRPVYIDVNKFLAAGGKIHEYAAIAADLDQMVANDPAMKTRVDAWKRVQVFEKEVLLEGKVPASAVQSQATVRLATGLRVVGFVGIAVSAYDLGKAGVESIEQGSPKPIIKQTVRTAGGFAGAWAGAKMGAGAGALLGIETGPGLLITGAIGGIAGGFAGYFGADWITGWFERQPSPPSRGLREFAPGTPMHFLK